MPPVPDILLPRDLTHIQRVMMPRPRPIASGTGSSAGNLGKGTLPDYPGITPLWGTHSYPLGSPEVAAPNGHTTSGATIANTSIGNRAMGLILLIILILLLFGGGGYGYSRYGYGGGVGIGGILLIVLIVYLLFGYGRF
jgi:hypothetical protein